MKAAASDLFTILMIISTLLGPVGLFLLGPLHLDSVNYDDVIFNSSFEMGNLINVSYQDGNSSGYRYYKATINYSTANFSERHWWFYFSMSNCTGKTIYVELENLTAIDFTDDRWPNIEPVYSYDPSNQTGWLRVPYGQFSWGNTTTRNYSITISPAQDKVWLAPIPPYTVSMRDELFAGYASNPYLNVTNLGITLSGLNFTVATITDPAYNDTLKTRIYIIAQQHSGETVGSWVAQGMIKFLLNTSDANATKIRQSYIFKIIPIINVEGVYYGISRYTPFRDGSQYDLNRVWDSDLNISKNQEVNWTFEDIQAWMPSAAIDLHGEVNGESAQGMGAEECFFLHSGTTDPRLTPFLNNISIGSAGDKDYWPETGARGATVAQAFAVNMRTRLGINLSMDMEHPDDNRTNTTTHPTDHNPQTVTDWEDWGRKAILGLSEYFGFINCPVINSSGTYVQDRDYIGTPNNASPLSGNACIKIVASDVIYDCAGYNLTDDGTSPGETFGVLLNGSLLNVTVKNCRIYDYSTGIYVNASNSSLFTNNTAYGNNDGFVVNNTENITLFNNTVLSNSQAGILVYQSNNLTLENNLVGDNGDNGFDIDNMNESSLINNTASNNNNTGIYLFSSSANTLHNNTAYGNNEGFVFNNTENITLFNNTANDNLDIGFTCENCLDLTILNSTANNNSVIGFSLVNASGVIANCSAKDNSIFDVVEDIFSTPVCGINFSDMNLSGDKPLLYIANGAQNFSDMNVSEILLCNASNSLLTNINVSGSETKSNNGLLISGATNITLDNINNSYVTGVLGFFASNLTINNSFFHHRLLPILFIASNGLSINNSLVAANDTFSVIFPGLVAITQSINTTIQNTQLLDSTGTNINLFLGESSGGEVINNTAAGGVYGFFVDNSANISLTDNNASFNTIDAFLVTNTTNTTIENNTAYNNAGGFHLYYADSSLLSNNTVENSTYALNQTDSENTHIINNTFRQNALVFYGSNANSSNVTNNLLCNNTVLFDITNSNASIYANRFCVSLYSPPNNTITNITTQEFNFSISNVFDQTNCSLVINGTENENATVENDSIYSLNHTFDFDQYEWQINCSDGNNTGTSNSNTITFIQNLSDIILNSVFAPAVMSVFAPTNITLNITYNDTTIILVSVNESNTFLANNTLAIVLGTSLYNISITPTQVGNITYTVLVDSNNSIPESNESNNNASFTSTVLSDIVLNNVSAPAVATVYNPITLQLNITCNSSNNLTILASINQSNIFLSNKTINLTAGTFLYNISISPTTTGNVIYTLLLDSNNSIPESNESNNNASVVIFVSSSANPTAYPSVTPTPTATPTPIASATPSPTPSATPGGPTTYPSATPNGPTTYPSASPTSSTQGDNDTSGNKSTPTPNATSTAQVQTIEISSILNSTVDATKRFVYTLGGIVAPSPECGICDISAGTACHCVALWFIDLQCIPCWLLLLILSALAAYLATRITKEKQYVIAAAFVPFIIAFATHCCTGISLAFFENVLLLAYIKWKKLQLIPDRKVKEKKKTN